METIETALKSYIMEPERMRRLNAQRRKRGMQIPDLKTFLIVCPLVFLGGLIDAIGGGGGLISLPAYLLAGIPAHQAIATNKMSAVCGTAVATVRLLKNRKPNIPIVLVSIAAAIVGASVGARLSLAADEQVILYMMSVLLPICAYVVLNKKLFRDPENEEIAVTGKMVLLSGVCALLCGVYDGFYGPGTGTFLIIAFTVLAKMSISLANTHAKIINLTTGVTSFIVFLQNGQVILVLGAVAALFNMIGGYVGAGLAVKKGSKLVRYSIMTVLLLLMVKVIFLREI